MAIPERVTRAARGALLAAMLLLAGCASFKFESPKLSVVNLRVQSADIFSQRLVVRMRVMNPNTRELPIKGINYRIEVDEAELAQGLADTPFVVPPMGETEFDVQVTANLAGALLKYLTRRESADSLQYRLVGEVALSSGFLRKIPFDERGSVKLK